VVEDVKKAKDLVNADEAKVTEMPKKDTVTKRTCGTIAYPPKAGMKTEDVKKEFEKLEVTVRRSLAGRGLDGDETTTSTAETQDIVTGDDNSEASDPAGSDDKDTDKDETSATAKPAGEGTTSAGERLATRVAVVLATFAAVAAALL
jgi:hypothetical protein